LKDHDKMLAAALPTPRPDAMVMAHMQVLPGWIDYNGHMTESRYLFAGSETSDSFLRLIGADIDYVKGGHSYYTAESHIMHQGEAKLGDRLTGSLQVLFADEKRLHIFMRISRGEEVMASIEQMLLHVDMKAGKVCPAAPEVLTRLMPIAEAHKALPRPEAAGRFVGQRK
jgi:carnitine 3-dehydrogenase